MSSISMPNLLNSSFEIDKVESIKESLKVSKQTCSNLLSKKISDNLVLSDKLKNVINKFENLRDKK